MSNCPALRCTGFSLAELVMVLAITLVLAAVAVPRMGNTLQRQRLDMASRRLLADLQLTRAQAIRDCADRRIELFAGMNGYTVVQYGGSAISRTVEFNAPPYEGVLLASSSYSPAVIQFNRLGLPQAGGNIILQSGTDQAVITISGTTGRATRRNNP